MKRLRPLLAATMLGCLVVGGTATAAITPSAHSTSVSATGLAHAVSGPKVFFWTTKGRPAAAPKLNQAPPDTMGANDLLYHGGVVQHFPHVYITYWGTEWKTGFTVGAMHYTQKTAMRYETTFFKHVGGSKWHGVQSQFCDGVAVGSISCGQGSNFVHNNKDVLKGVWIDPTPAPPSIVATGLAENIVTDPIASEAVKASEHFGTKDPDATFFIFTPPNHAATAYGSVYCAYHSEVTNVGSHGIHYAFMPFTPEQGAGCGGNSVNKENDAFGHGYFDSYTLAGGHEFEEAVTDPNAFPTQDGWNDYQTSENGDKCAYFHAANIKFGKFHFAVQPMWSNEANHGSGGCAMKRGTGTFPIPPLTPVGP